MNSQNMGNQRGEIILIILLVMAVGLTIGLAVASRSITDIRLSNQVEESSRAFSAAEAGIEEALKSGLIGAGSSINGSVGGTNYNVQLNDLIASSNNVFTFPTQIEEGDTQTIWLVPQRANGTGPNDDSDAYGVDNIRICWANLGTPQIPAVEVSLLFKSTSGEYKVARNGYDPDSTRNGPTGNGFSSGGLGNQCGFNESVNYTTFINFNSNPFSGGLYNTAAGDFPIALRIKPVYEKTKIGVVAGAGGSIPAQGKNIISTGQTGSGVERRWNVVQTYAAPNDIFDYAVWSETDLSK